MKTIIRIQNINSYIEGNFPREVIDKVLSYFISGFFMSRLFRFCQHCKGEQKINPKTGRCPKCQKPRIWDGRKRLLLGGRGTPYFPTGCLTMVVDVLTRMGYEVGYVDERASCLLPALEQAHTVNLLDPDGSGNIRETWKHQKEAIHAALKYQRGVIQAPTSSGKTSVMSAIVKLIPEPAAILIHNKSIAKQLKDEIEAMLGEEVGIIKEGKFDPRRVTIVMVQSLTHLLSLDPKSKKEKIPPDPEVLEFVKRTKVLLLDECHHTSSNTWYDICKLMKNAYFRIGVTGTAFMRSAGDDLLLIGATGPLIYEISEQELIDLGILAKPYVHVYHIDQPIGIDELEYQTAYDQGVVNNLYLNTLAAKLITDYEKEGLQSLVLFEHINHINNVSALLKVPHEILVGKDDSDDRAEVLASLESGDTHILLASRILDEGISVNNIDVVIKMAGMRTKIKCKQEIGRGQRRKKDKPNVVQIVDFLYTNNKHLQNHSMARCEMYKSLNYSITLHKQNGTTTTIN